MTFNRPIAHRNPKPLSLWASSLAAAVAFAFGMAAHAANVDYVYDDNGRLVGVYAPSGDVAQYVYDPAGNITQINRIAAGTFAVIDFFPKSGPVGTQVTIWGSGFSATLEQNVVTVNGVAASVVSATTTKLVVTVPSGASTGPIMVTVGTSSGTTNPYVVTASVDCAGRFSGFSPNIGTAGALITVSGTSLDTGPVTVLFNGTAASIQSITSSTATVAVPAGATSGHISAAIAPACALRDLGDFFIPPSGYASSEIGAMGRLTINGPMTPVSLAANNDALFLFDAAAGIGTALYLTGSTLGTVTADIRLPDGSVLSSTTLTTTSGHVGPLYLPMLGGFSIFIHPSSGIAGSISLQLAAPDLSVSNSAAGTITENQNGSFNVPVSFTVTNLGPIGALPNWSDYGYLSTLNMLQSSSKALGSYIRNTALASGASYNVNQTYSVSAVSPGSYTLFIKSDSNGGGTQDPNGVVVEADEGNNLSPGIPLVLPDYPDLAISNGSVGSIGENQNGTFSVPVSFTVTNVGPTTAQAPWYDYAYLSSTGSLDSSSTTIGNASFHSTALAAGASYSVSQTNTTSMPPGSYTLFLKTDGQAGSLAASPGVVVEGSESNNVVGIDVVLPTYPDLTISSSSVGAITENQNGTFSVPVTFTVTNAGTTSAQPNWYDYGYLSQNGVLDSSSTTFGSTFHGSVLSGGASYTVSQTYVASGFAPGAYTLFFKADGQPSAVTNGVLVESDEANNATTGVSASLPPYPDLAISNPSIGTITKNTNGSYNIPVTFTVTNLSTTSAKPNWYDYGYLSQNGVLDSNSTAFGQTFRGTALAGEATYTVSATYVASGVASGSYTLFLKADGQSSAVTNGFVVESDETNNATAGIAVTLP